jgi:hypothetical protein
MSLKAWKDLYPEAELIGPQGVEVKVTDLKFDFLFTDDKLERSFGSNEIVAHFFPGYDSKEVAFLHVPTKTLLNADLAENLPAREQFSLSGVDPESGFWTSLFIRMFSPNNWVHNFVIWHVFAKDKTYVLRLKDSLISSSMKRDVKVVSSWDFDRLVPCHGDVMETGAKQYWNALYARFVR